jgi:hypothetical protein
MTVNDLINRKTSLPKAFKWYNAPSDQWYGIIEEDVSGMKWLSEKLGDAEVSRLISEEENYDGDHVVFTFKLRAENE